MSPPHPWILAIDGGGSKTDAVALSPDGALLAHVRGPGLSPQVIGPAASVAGLDRLLDDLRARAGMGSLHHAAIYLSGLDFEEEIAAFRTAATDRWWLPPTAILDNDLFALLRAGTTSPDAVVVVVGTGINALGLRADGATGRYAALGALSGDWGGGGSLGAAAVWHAARSEDGRGPRTALQQLVAAFFGVASIADVSAGLHFGRLEQRSIPRLSELVFAAAADGDGVATSLVDRQADEVVVMVSRLIETLDLRGRSVPVVMGGGVLAAGDDRLLTRIRLGLEERVPDAVPQLVRNRPILGAALLALEESTPVGPDVQAALERALRERDRSVTAVG